MASAVGIIESKGIAALIAAADSILKNSKVKILGLHKLPTGLLSIAFSGDKEYVEHAMEIGKETVYQIGELFSSSLIVEPEENTLELLKEIYFKLGEDKSPLNIKLQIKEENSERTTPVPATKPKKKTGAIKKIKVEEPAIVKEELAKPVVASSQKKKKPENEEKHPDPEISTSTIERLRKEALGFDKAETESQTSEHKIENDKKDVIININELEKLNVHKLRKFARSLEDFPIKGRQISLANRNVLLDYFRSL